MTDLRADIDSPAGGVDLAGSRYRSAVERLSRLALLPTEAPARRLALESTSSLIGFWVLWHCEGGLEGLERLGFPRSSVYRKIKAFTEAFGEHPDVYRFPGIGTPDVEAYLEHFGLPDGERSGMPRVITGAREHPARLPRP